jgi:hypothetical protein
LNLDPSSKRVDKVLDLIALPTSSRAAQTKHAPAEIAF